MEKEYWFWEQDYFIKDSLKWVYYKEKEFKKHKIGVLKGIFKTEIENSENLKIVFFLMKELFIIIKFLAKEK